jgi:zinc transporter
LSAFHDLAAQSYGGDEAGLICGYLFDAAAPEPARAIDSAQAAAWLGAQGGPKTLPITPQR